MKQTWVGTEGFIRNNPVKYTEPDGRSITATLVITAPIWGTALTKALSVGIAFGLGAITGWNLAKAIDNAQQQQAENKPSPMPKEGASSGQTTPAMPEPDKDPNDNNKDKQDGKKYEHREVNEAKREFSKNNKFRDYFHREYKPDQK